MEEMKASCSTSSKSPTDEVMSFILSVQVLLSVLGMNTVGMDCLEDKGGIGESPSFGSR